jgi:phage-related protein
MKALGDLGTIFKGVFQIIWGVIQVVWNVGVIGSISKGFAAIKAIFGGSLGAIKGIFTASLDSIKGAMMAFLDALKAGPSAVMDSLKGIFSTAWGAIKNVFSTALDGLKKIGSVGLDDLKGIFTSLPGKILGWLGDLGGLLWNAGIKLIEGFIGGIGSMFGKVKDKLGDLTDKLTSWKGPAPVDAVLLYDAGRLVIGGFINGLESQYDAVKKSLTGLTNDIGSMSASPTINVGARLAAQAAGALADTSGGYVDQRQFNYHAAPGNSLSSEEDLFAAVGRSRFAW